MGFVIRISRVRVRIRVRVRVRVAEGERERGRRKRRRRGQGFCMFSLDFSVRRRFALFVDYNHVQTNNYKIFHKA